MPNKLFLQIRETVNKYDPAGILYDENPDEYDSEVEEVIKLAGGRYSAEELSQELRKIFVHHFTEDVAGNVKQYSRMASELQLLSEFGLK